MKEASPKPVYTGFQPHCWKRPNSGLSGKSVAARVGGIEVGQRRVGTVNLFFVMLWQQADVLKLLYELEDHSEGLTLVARYRSGV